MGEDDRLAILSAIGGLFLAAMAIVIAVEHHLAPWELRLPAAFLMLLAGAGLAIPAITLEETIRAALLQLLGILTVCGAATALLARDPLASFGDCALALVVVGAAGVALVAWGRRMDSAAKREGGAPGESPTPLPRLQP